MNRITVFLLLIIAFLPGCNREAAVVNGKVIYDSEIKARIGKLDPAQTEKYEKGDIKNVILKGRIQINLVLSDLREKGYDKRNEVLREWASIENEMKLKYFLNEYLPEKRPVSGRELRKLYDKKKEQYRQEGRIHVRQILVRAGNGTHTWDEAEKKITLILGEIQKDGKNFADIAKKYSGNGATGGKDDLGYFGRGEMDPVFEKAAFSLKEKEYTREPVKTRYGYHLIYLEDRNEDTFVPLEDVRKELSTVVQIQKLKESYQPVYYYKRINRNRPGYVVGELKKTGLKYTNRMFYNDLVSFFGSGKAPAFYKTKANIQKALEEMLSARIMNQESEICGMEEDDSYQEYIQPLRDEYLARRYINTVVLRDVSVSEKDVMAEYRKPETRKKIEGMYGKKFKEDLSFRKRVERESVLPGIRQQLMDDAREKEFVKYITGLEKKYPVEVKIRY